jgi:hypothetical protein
VGWSSKLQFLASNTRFMGWIYIYIVMAKTSTDQKVVSGAKTSLALSMKTCLIEFSKIHWQSLRACEIMISSVSCCWALSDAGNHPVSLSGLFSRHCLSQRSKAFPFFWALAATSQQSLCSHVQRLSLQNFASALETNTASYFICSFAGYPLVN